MTTSGASRAPSAKRTSPPSRASTAATISISPDRAAPTKPASTRTDLCRRRDHEHVAIAEGTRLDVVRGVDQSGREPVPPGPRWNHRTRVVPGADDHAPSAHLASRGDDKPACRVAIHAAHFSLCLDPQIESPLVFTQVLDHVRSPGPASVAARYSVGGEVGKCAWGVQPQALIAALPRESELLLALEHERLDAAAFERTGNRESRGARARHDHKLTSAHEG